MRRLLASLNSRHLCIFRILSQQLSPTALFFLKGSEIFTELRSLTEEPLIARMIICGKFIVTVLSVALML
jgi:hypothetical protein